jgi:hypothetical protein
MGSRRGGHCRARAAARSHPAELTDEARAVPEAANQIQAGFTITQPIPLWAFG